MSPMIIPTKTKIKVSYLKADVDPVESKRIKKIARSEGIDI